MARVVIRYVRAGGGAVVLLASVAYVAAEDIERLAMSRVRLTTEASAVKACTRVGWVNDDSAKDLRRKIIRSGGDTGLITFGIGDDMSQIYAQVYRCPQPAAHTEAGTGTSCGPPPPVAPPGPTR